MNLTPEEQKQLSELIDSDVRVNEYSWEADFQRQIIGMLLSDKYFTIQCRALIDSKYFTNDIHKKVCECLFNYFDQYKHLPSRTFLLTELNNNCDDKVKTKQTVELDTILEFYVPNLESRDYLVDKIANFAKINSLKNAFEKSLDLIKKKPNDESIWPSIGNLLRDALIVDRNFDIGLDYFQTVDERYERVKEKDELGEYFTSGFDAIDNALSHGGLGRGEIFSWVGLCFAKGTKVMMFDGTIKNVEDVQIDDELMGDDSTPRKVLKLSNGFAELYKITPVKGEPYIVTKNHILSLKSSAKTPLSTKRANGRIYRRPNIILCNHPSRMGNTNIFNISVEDYMKQTASFRNKMKTYRMPVDFKSKTVRIDPYFLGLWLGDGTCNSCQTNQDEEVINAVYSEAEKRGLSVNKVKPLHYSMVSSGMPFSNSLRGDLRFYGLLKDYTKKDKNYYEYKKFIPECYKLNSKECRLQILAGLIDTDGDLGSNCFGFINKSKKLVEDVIFVARSLGFSAYLSECRKKSQNGTWGTYYRTCISGDTSQIPTRIKHKKATTRKQIKDVLVTGFKIESIGIGEYYGFSVDGNHLFLLNDFTVVHNSGSGKSLMLVTSAIDNITRFNKRVLYISIEMGQDEIAERFDAPFANINIFKLIENKDLVKQALEEQVADQEDKRLLVIKQFPSGTLDVSTLRAYHQQCVLNGFKPDVVIVDYVGEMKDYPDMPTWESRFRIVRDLRGFAIEEQVCVLTAMQPGKSAREAQKKDGFGSGVIDDENLADAFGQIRPLDGCWSINQMADEKDCYIARIFVIKHRHGKSRFIFHVEYNKETLKITQITKDEYEKRWKKHQNEKEIHASSAVTLPDFKDKAKKELGDSSENPTVD